MPRLNICITLNSLIVVSVGNSKTNISSRKTELVNQFSIPAEFLF